MYFYDTEAIQCTPLLKEKGGVAPDVTFRITAHKQERVQERDPHKVHKMGFGLTKMLIKGNFLICVL